MKKRTQARQISKQQAAVRVLEKKVARMARQKQQRQQTNLALAEAGSKQPRFDEDFVNSVWGSVYSWVRKSEQDEPKYTPDSRALDQWLRTFWPQEPHLAGVVNSVVGIDKNRGWTITGGRNSVNYYHGVMTRAENNAGWRPYVGKTSTSWWTSNVGFITETERDGLPGRLVNIYHVDSARCRLLGGPRSELEYHPRNGGAQTWYAKEYVETGGGETLQTPADYFRAASMINTDEAYNDLGFCAVMRALKLAQLMIAVVEHDREKLGAAAPTGLLLLNNISEEQWEDAMTMREENLVGKEREWFSGVAVLASAIDEVDAKLVALSQLPDNFERDTFVEYLIYGYALCFGYESGEFWPKMRAGGLGTTYESSIQHQKSSGKGALEFPIEHEAQLNAQLPDHVVFRYEARDDEGKRLAAETKLSELEVITTMYETGLKEGAPLVSHEEARSLMAEAGLIPDDWTAMEEDVIAADNEPVRMRQLRRQALEMPQVRRAIELYPNEPIVRRHWPIERVDLLWESGYDAQRPTAWPGWGKRTAAQLQKVVRQLEINQDEVLYEDDDLDFTITGADVISAHDNALDEVAELMEAETINEEAA